MNIPASELRSNTGIPNMEKLIGGGLPKGSCVLVSGKYGTGKTTFALQYLTKGITDYGELGIFVTFLDDKEDLMGDAKQFGWQVKRLKNAGALRIMSGPPGRITGFDEGDIESGKEILKKIVETVEKHEAERLVIDGLDELSDFFETKSEFRSGIASLRRELIKRGCTSVLTSTSDDDLGEIVDSVIVLHYESSGLGKNRAVEIRKMRKSSHTSQICPFEITDEGIIITGPPKEKEPMPPVSETEAKPAPEAEEVQPETEDITKVKESAERQEFLHSLLRHDLKNKVQIAKGYLKLLEDADMSEEYKGMLNKTMKAIDDSTDLIEKVRTLQKAEEESEIQEFNAGSMVKRAIDKYEPFTSDLGVKIDSEEFECKIRGGPLLEELFANLIENSIQHSECERIDISARENEDECIVTVEDDGKGIPDDIRDRIFEEGFKKGKGAGSGLGLSLVKEIAESYGGNIELKESELGGARFDVHLKK